MANGWELFAAQRVDQLKGFREANFGADSASFDMLVIYPIVRGMHGLYAV